MLEQILVPLQATLDYHLRPQNHLRKPKRPRLHSLVSSTILLKQLPFRQKMYPKLLKCRFRRILILNKLLQILLLL